MSESVYLLHQMGGTVVHQIVVRYMVVDFKVIHVVNSYIHSHSTYHVNRSKAKSESVSQLEIR